MSGKRRGRKPIICPHGILGKSICKKCRKEYNRKHYNRKSYNKNQKFSKEKYCIDCNLLLSKEDLTPSFRKKKYYLCRKCARKRSIKWIKENPEKYKSRAGRYRKRRIFIINFLGGKCTKCGLKVVCALDLHHINGIEDEKRIRLERKPWNFIKKYLKENKDNLQILCANHHRMAHHLSDSIDP